MVPSKPALGPHRQIQSPGVGNSSSARAAPAFSVASGAHAEELHRLNWALAAYARSSAALIHSATFEELVAGVCHAIVGEDHYLLAAAGLVEEGPGEAVRMVAGAGRAVAYLEGLSLSGAEMDGFGHGPTARAIRSGEPSIMRDAREEPAQSPWRKRALDFGIRSSVTVPFLRGGRVAGVLKVYANKPDAFGTRELDVFAQLGRELAFALGVLEERSQRRAAEEARGAAEERAQESLAELARAARVVSLGAFAASLAHEVNQPVAAIMANGEAALRWLSKSPANLEEVRAALVRITRDAERTSAVVGRTRGMLAKGLGQRQMVDVGQLLEETIQFTHPQLRRAQVRAEVTVAEGLPQAWVDPVQVQQVMVNLVTNATDAMRPVTGRRRVLRAFVELCPDGMILIRVADTGTGIGEAYADRVFDHLFTTKPEGVGLGLPICKSIVEAHGGRISMKPNSPFGTVFSFTLPPVADDSVPN
jgi:signal transduction histidine kinase